MHNKSSDKYLYNRDGVYRFFRRIPTDISDHYRSSRIQMSVRTKNVSVANRCARSIIQGLDDYWLGLRLQKLDIPAMNLINMDIDDSDDGFRLSDALDLYLKLKGEDKDKIFIRTAHRNIEYVIQVLANKSFTT